MFLKKGFICVITIFLLLISFQLPVDAAEKTWTEEQISYVSEELQMSGTVLKPNTPGKHPGIVLIGGSGQEEQEDVRKEAEMFVKAGYITLIYDKRGDDPSYSLLAKDALAGVKALQKRSDVQANQVGLWGFSEGGWVAPLAAAQSDQVAFLIVVGAPIVKPIQQQAWHLENRFQYHGVTSPSLLQAITHKGARFVLTSGIFPEGVYDPVPILAKLKQPILAIWGEQDRMSPPVEGAKTLAQTLDNNGNKYYSIQFLAKAEHAAHRFQQAGFQRLDEFAPGYEPTIVHWLEQVTQGTPPKQQQQGNLPKQWSASDPTVSTIHWYDSFWLHVSLLVLYLCLFCSPLLWPLFSRKKKINTISLPWFASCLSVAGMIASFGFASYLIYIWGMNGAKTAPLLVIADKPLVWVVIQLFSWITIICTICLMLWGWKMRKTAKNISKVQLWILLSGGVLFIPWAIYWHLFM